MQKGAGKTKGLSMQDAADKSKGQKKGKPEADASCDQELTPHIVSSSQHYQCMQRLQEEHVPAQSSLNAGSLLLEGITLAACCAAQCRDVLLELNTMQSSQYTSGICTSILQALLHLFQVICVLI